MLAYGNQVTRKMLRHARQGLRYSMIRVLLVPSSDYLGHPFPQRCNQIFERLHDKRAFEVHAVRFRIFNEPKLKTNVIIHELSNAPMGHFAFYYLMNMIRHACEIRRIVREERIDIVVLSHLAAPFAYTLMDEVSKARVPVIFDLPDFFPTSATGYVSDLESVGGKLLTGMFDAMLRYMLRHATAVTTASHALAQYAMAIGGQRVVCIPNGISECFFQLHDGVKMRGMLGFDQHDIVVGYIGSVEFWLDMRNFIKGIALTRKHGLPLKLLLVGKELHTDYPKKVKAMLETDIPGVTKWLDFVDHERLPEYVAALDIGAMPFNVHDPTAYYAAPNKLWEYLSQRIPVISTPIPDAIFNKDVLYLARTPIDYANSIERIVSGDPELEGKMERGRKQALERSWSNSSKLLSELITEISDRSQ